ncbi:CoA transferase, partial [Mycolicibacterium hippocampi]|uniref:CoA transferase n=1 Tax=Mycolicibacterium hippocampi TaxID=659824 RepID=UPI003510E24C
MVEKPLLASLRVLDLCSGAGDAVGRILADLGADVLKIEPPGGSPARGSAPMVAGAGIGFALDNANPRCAVLEPGAPADRRALIELAGDADIVIDSQNPGAAAAFGTSCRELSQL